MAGIDVDQLKDDAAAGQISVEQLIELIAQQAEQLAQQAEEMQPSLGRDPCCRRAGAGVKNREFDRHDLPEVANEPIANALGGAIPLGEGAHQFAPRGIFPTCITRMNCDFAGLKRIHRVNFQTVQILLRDVVGFHPAERPGAANNGSALGES